MTSSTFIGVNEVVHVCSSELLLDRRGIHRLNGKKDKRLAFSDIERIEFRDPTCFCRGFIHFVSSDETPITSIFPAVQNENCIVFKKSQRASFRELSLLVQTIYRLGHLPAGFKPYVEKTLAPAATKTSNTLSPDQIKVLNEYENPRVRVELERRAKYDPKSAQILNELKQADKTLTGRQKSRPFTFGNILAAPFLPLCVGAFVLGGPMGGACLIGASVLLLVGLRSMNEKLATKVGLAWMALLAGVIGGGMMLGDSRTDDHRENASLNSNSGLTNAQLLRSLGEGVARLADACDTMASEIAAKTKASVGRRENDIIALTHPATTEIDLGCPTKYGTFIAMFWGTADVPSDFFNFVSIVGNIFTGTSVTEVRSKAETCLRNALRAGSGSSELKSKQFTYVCSAGANYGGLSKVTIERSF